MMATPEALIKNLPMTKSLADITQINYRYQRSARIDHDNSIENIQTFIVHETAKSTLKEF